MRAVNRARGEVDGRGGEGGVAEALGRARDAAGERDGRRGVALAARPGHVDRRHRKAERRGARRCESLQPRNLDAGGRGGLVGKGGGEVLCPRGALVEGDRELVRRHRQHQPAGLRRHPPHLDGLLVSRANGKQTRRRGGAVGVGEVLRDPVVCGDAAVAEVAVPLARLPAPPTACRRRALCSRVQHGALVASRVDKPDDAARLWGRAEEIVDAKLLHREGIRLAVRTLRLHRKEGGGLVRRACEPQPPRLLVDCVGVERVGRGEGVGVAAAAAKRADHPPLAVEEDVQLHCCRTSAAGRARFQLAVVHAAAVVAAALPLAVEEAKRRGRAEGAENADHRCGFVD
mmetsp:Transcript_36508/g.114664  ORF Transcript_36508/g.114664 Transcript_36508/m.114664 type:complete len:345 (+) Transcript_36508:230-1264(+)